ncbi:hypothetical protein PC122_g21044 [Phytophthora cactorum]|nr:hypothetical protein PC122_g21044 [Phytophthora cactorum]
MSGIGKDATITSPVGKGDEEVLPSEGEGALRRKSLLTMPNGSPTKIYPGLEDNTLKKKPSKYTNGSTYLHVLDALADLTQRCAQRHATLGLVMVAVGYLGVFIKLISCRSSPKKAYLVHQAPDSNNFVKKVGKSLDDAAARPTRGKIASAILKFAAALAREDSAERKMSKLLMNGHRAQKLSSTFYLTF